MKAAPWLGWLLALLVAAGWWFASRPDPAALDRERGFQAHAESLAARRQREDRAASDTVRVYVTRLVSARAATDTLLVPILGTVVPDSGTCNIAGIRLAFADSLRPLLTAERAWADSTIAFLERRVLSQGNMLTDYASLTDSLQAELQRANRRTRPPRIAVVAGVALTPRGIQPALTLGLRVPLPRL